MQTPIKTIFFDIDGVILGTQNGYNYPQPNIAVIKKLKSLNDSGIKVSLCSAKAFFCVKNTIEICGLNAYHITDGGAVIYNPFTNEKEVALLDTQNAVNLVEELIKSNLYAEVYTIDDYYIAKTDKDITERHIGVVRQDPKVEPDLSMIIEKNDIIKIMLITTNKEQEEIINKLGEKYKEVFDLSWGIHPLMQPMGIAWFSVKGINKGTCVKKVMQLENSSPENSLGAGDSTNDWNFVQLCKYVATLENGTVEIQEFVKSRGVNGYICPSVEENGILKALEYFGL
jgi:HAD superfamily hydrolase (TIGR01484 family)